MFRSGPLWQSGFHLKTAFHHTHRVPIQKQPVYRLRGIAAGAPFVEAMAVNLRLQTALTGVMAAIVGVILNLAVWFGHKEISPGGQIDYFAVAMSGIGLFLH